MVVAQLSSPYREAITFVELENKTTKKTAEIVGGARKLRELFDRCCEIAFGARGKPTDFTARSCKTC